MGVSRSISSTAACSRCGGTSADSTAPGDSSSSAPEYAIHPARPGRTAAPARSPAPAPAHRPGWFPSSRTLAGWKMSGFPSSAVGASAVSPSHTRRALGKPGGSFVPRPTPTFCTEKAGRRNSGQCGNQCCPGGRGQLARPGVGRAVGGHRRARCGYKFQSGWRGVGVPAHPTRRRGFHLALATRHTLPPRPTLAVRCRTRPRQPVYPRCPTLPAPAPLPARHVPRASACQRARSADAA